MALYEHMPYTNYENVNLDWIIKTVKQLEERVTTIEGQIVEIQTSITNIQADLTSIWNHINQIEGDIQNIYDIINQLDLQTIINRLNQIEENIQNIQTQISNYHIEELWETVRNLQNIVNNYYNSLSYRISVLERAVINPINEEFSLFNQISGGDSFRNTAVGANGLPWGATMKVHRQDTEDNDYTIHYTPDGFTYQAEPGSRISNSIRFELDGQYLGSADTDPSRHFTVTFRVQDQAGFTSTYTDYTHQIIAGAPAIKIGGDGADDPKLGTVEIVRNLAEDANCCYLLEWSFIGYSGYPNTCSDLSGKYVTAIKVVPGDLDDTGLYYNNSLKVIADNVNKGQLFDLQDIIMNQYSKTYDHVYTIALQPSDGSQSYVYNAKLHVQLANRLGILTGFWALYMTLDNAGGTQTFNMTNPFTLNVDISGLAIPHTVTPGTVVHSYVNLVNNLQLEGYFVDGVDNIASIHLEGMSAPITLTAPSGSRDKLLCVVKVNELCDWWKDRSVVDFNT